MRSAILSTNPSPRSSSEFERRARRQERRRALIRALRTVAALATEEAADTAEIRPSRTVVADHGAGRCRAAQVVQSVDTLVEGAGRMVIAVKTALSTFECEVGVCDHCAYCGSPIVWGHDRKGKPVALEPWDDGKAETEVHLLHCDYRP